MDPRLLDILCCPLTRVPLRLLKADELAALNRAVATGRVASAAGRTLTEASVAGLITINGRTIYRIEDDIPVMLADEAIATDQVTHFPRSASTAAC